ncbi:nucleotidyltransferase domain-containing protein [Lentzea sp. BCCO 10_0798]|uniref:Nucleotidyltransferase domain-containing protein n=1 Tax=Lentzea kristufekii TaxID=3095430 RepID=A0ABU4U5T5_9PSEU|nr:nucleotidyltransferase domain-containing protein [Lentzea sp. BCCO 10_0798]MDX8055929.1 nucleotidyltransferase domain-containing protein [Lentzea sp. BCCO 10_0798]
MFSVSERDQLRRDLVNAADVDPRVVGAALTGSAAVGREDRWSDIDFALSVERDVDAVVVDWTALMYACGAVGHLDVRSGKTLFRVFLMRSTLQVDIAFWPSDEFGATGPTFKLLFGEANQVPQAGQPDRDDLIGLAWLYALHARSSIARGRGWQALYMINGMRDHVMSLWCLREGVNAVQGRGLDDLRDADAFAGTVVLSTHPDELRRAFQVLTGLLLEEITEPELREAVRALSP